MTNPIASPLALLAGLATVASPCVLPVLPFLLGATVEQRNRRRPLLIVALKPGETATSDEMLTFLEGKIAKWWTPDEVAFVEAIPLNATGKIDKKTVRAAFEGYRLSAVEPVQ